MNFINVFIIWLKDIKKHIRVYGAIVFLTFLLDQFYFIPNQPMNKDYEEMAPPELVDAPIEDEEELDSKEDAISDAKEGYYELYSDELSNLPFGLNNIESFTHWLSEKKGIELVPYWTVDKGEYEKQMSKELKSRFNLAKLLKEWEQSFAGNFINNGNISSAEAQFWQGESSLHDFVQYHFKMPKSAQENGLSGMTFVQFIIEKDGKIESVNVIGNEVSPEVSKESIRVIKLSDGYWSPAIQNGEAKRSYFRFPIEVDNDGF